MKVLLPVSFVGRLAHQPPRPELELISYAGPAEALERIAAAEVYYGHISPELVRAGRHLRWIQVFRAGIDAYLFPEVVNSDIVLTNGSGTNSTHLADHLMAFILAFNRNFPHLGRCQQREVWENRHNMPAMELGGETLLIVGLGGAGLELAKRAAAFGMRILVVTRSAKPPVSGIERIAGMHELSELLPQADHVAICCALTPQTRHLFSDREFRLMRPTAFIHNIARGAIIDQAALVRALQSATIAGAGLDVTDPEPLPPGHPLWHLPNVLLTTHTSGHSPHVERRLFELFAENLRRYVAGEPLLNVVDKRAGV